MNNYHKNEHIIKINLSYIKQKVIYAQKMSFHLFIQINKNNGKIITEKIVQMGYIFGAVAVVIFFSGSAPANGKSKN